jgi:hypothetical protein
MEVRPRRERAFYYRGPAIRKVVEGFVILRFAQDDKAFQSAPLLLRVANQHHICFAVAANDGELFAVERIIEAANKF